MNEMYGYPQDLTFEDRTASIQLVNQFFKMVNQLPLDGLFSIKPRAAVKFVDLYLKLSGTGKVYFRGIKIPHYNTQKLELVSLLIARIEEKPFLKEEKTLYIDIAVTKSGKKKQGYMKLLVKDLENWAKEKQIPSIELRALQANQEAISFWNHMGYQPFYIRFRKALQEGKNLFTKP